MDFTAEKKESESKTENAHPTTLDSSSQLASALDSNNKEIEERQARELKAGLHPLKVPLSLTHTLLFSFHHHSIAQTLPTIISIVVVVRIKFRYVFGAFLLLELEFQLDNL